MVKVSASRRRPWVLIGMAFTSVFLFLLVARIASPLTALVSTGIVLALIASYWWLEASRTSRRYQVSQPARPMARKET